MTTTTINRKTPEEIRLANNARSRAWKKAHRLQVNEINRRWYQACKAEELRRIKRNEYSRKWKAAHRPISHLVYLKARQEELADMRNGVSACL